MPMRIIRLITLLSIMISGPMALANASYQRQTFLSVVEEANDLPTLLLKQAQDLPAEAGQGPRNSFHCEIGASIITRSDFPILQQPREYFVNEELLTRYWSSLYAYFHGNSQNTTHLFINGSDGIVGGTILDRSQNQWDFSQIIPCLQGTCPDGQSFSSRYEGLVRSETARLQDITGKITTRARHSTLERAVIYRFSIDEYAGAEGEIRILNQWTGLPPGLPGSFAVLAYYYENNLLSLNEANCYPMTN